MKDYLDQLIEKVIKNNKIKVMIYIILSVITFISTFNLRSAYEFLIFGLFMISILVFAFMRRYLNKPTTFIIEIVVVSFMLSMIVTNYIYGSPFYYIYNEEIEAKKVEKIQNRKNVEFLYLIGQEQYSKLIDIKETNNNLTDWRLSVLWNECNSEELYKYITHENEGLDQNYIRIIYLSSLFKEKKYSQIIEFYDEYEDLINDSFIKTIYCYSLLMSNETEKLRNTISHITILECENSEQLNFQTDFWISLFEHYKQTDEELALVGLAQAYKFNCDYFNEYFINDYNPIANWDLWLYSNQSKIIEFVNNNIGSTIESNQYSRYTNDIVSFGKHIGAKKTIEYDYDFKNIIGPVEFIDYCNILDDAENLIAFITIPNNNKMLYLTNDVEFKEEESIESVSNFSVFQFDGKINRKVYSTDNIWLPHNIELISFKDRTFVKYLETSFDYLKIFAIDHLSSKCSEINITDELMSYHSSNTNILENNSGYEISWNAQVMDFSIANVDDKIDATNYLQLSLSNSIKRQTIEYTNPAIELFQNEELLNFKLYKGKFDNSVEGDLFKECLKSKHMHYVRNNVDNIISSLFKVNDFNISSSIIYFDDCNESDASSIEVTDDSTLNREYYTLLFDNTRSSTRIIGVFKIENYGQVNYEISDSILSDIK